MNRNQAFASNYLGQEDVPQPLRVTIADVRIEKLHDRDANTMRDKPVMCFREQNIKPLIVNNINWTICETAYGEDSDGWLGKTIEVFHDPNVMFGKRRTGGIRIRIPTASPTQQRQQPPAQTHQGNGKHGTQTTQQPAAKGATPAPTQKRPLTIEEKHRMIVGNYKSAPTEAKLNEWLLWSRNFVFALPMQGEQQKEYDLAMERIALAEAPADVPPPIDEENIPF